VVVHDAFRDNYQLPVALAEAGLLERFVTDWYTPMEKPLWRWIAGSRLGKSAFDYISASEKSSRRRGGRQEVGVLDGVLAASNASKAFP